MFWGLYGMSTLRVDSIRGQTADGTNRYVVQVLSTTKTDTFTTSTNSFVDCTGLNVSITPSNANNKVLLSGRMSFCHENQNTGCLMRIVRVVDGVTTEIGSGDASGSRGSGMMELSSSSTYMIRQAAIDHLDSPSTTSAINYKVQIFTRGNQISVNRNHVDDDNIHSSRVSSTITVMEIAQ